MTSRYAPAVALLLALALVPTILHSYVGARTYDGRTMQAIPMLLDGMLGAPTKRGTAWAESALKCTDCIERQYGAGLTLFVARSYDAKRLYHHPELSVAYGKDFQTASVVRAASRPDVPVHRLTGARAAAVYALLHRNTFVENPLRFEVQRALFDLFRPRDAMTLFFVHGPASDLSAAEKLLLAALSSFESQTNSHAR